MKLFDWGGRTPEEKELQRKIELESLYEQARVAKVKANANSGGAAGGGRSVQPVAASSGTIVFNGDNPTTTGSYVAVSAVDLNAWLPDAAAGFTVEWFQKFDNNNSGSFPRVWSIGPDTSPILGVSLEGALYVWPLGLAASWATSPDGRWAHVAVVWSQSGGRVAIFLDGVRQAFGDGNTINLDNSAHNYNLYIGSDGLSPNDGFAGNITNFRWTNSAVYSPLATTIPVPSSPLAQLSNTKLLLLGGSEANPVVDSTGTNLLEYSNIAWSPETPF